MIFSVVQKRSFYDCLTEPPGFSHGEHQKDLKWHSKELIEGYPYIKVTVPIKVYPEKSVGFDYGWESGISHKVNHFFDDMIRLIRKANEELNNK